MFVILKKKFKFLAERFDIICAKREQDIKLLNDTLVKEQIKNKKLENIIHDKNMIINKIKIKRLELIK